MGIQKIVEANDVNCRRGAVSTGGSTSTWTPKVYECGTVLDSGVASTRFDELDYYCCNSGTGTTVVNEGDTYYVTNIVQISGSGAGDGLTYLELGQTGTIAADVSGEITNAPRIPGATSYTFTIVNAVATLGASGDGPTKVGLYITDRWGTTGSPIHFTIARNDTYHIMEGIVGQTIPPSGYRQQNIVTAGTGAADLTIGLYGTLT